MPNTKHINPLITRDDELKNNLIKRTNRIEGQIRGINKMIAEDAYCDDVLTQISAARSALNSISKLVLEHHMRGCLVEDIQNGDENVIDELLVTIGRIIK